MRTCFIDSNKLGEERSFCTYYGGTGVFSNEEVDKIKKPEIHSQMRQPKLSDKVIKVKIEKVLLVGSFK